MQENEFEKRVREMMEEFKISPSDAVWDKVEQQIPTQKRRRRWVIFVFLLTGLMVSGYFMYNNYYSRSVKMESVAEKKQEEKAIDNVSDNKKSEESNASIATHSNNSGEKNQEEKNTIAINKKVDNNIGSIINEKTQLSRQVEKREMQTPGSEILITNEKNNAGENAEKNISNDTANKKTNAFNASEQIDSLSKNILKDSAQTITRSTKTQTSKNERNKKWQLGITAFYGRSDVFENLLGIKFNSASSADYAASPGTVSGFPANPNPATYSTETKAKSAFSLGLSLMKDISTKSSLTIGLQYSKFQTEIETGAKEDSVAIFRYNNLNAAPTINLDNYYKPGTGYPHTNTYSLIQIPVVYEHSITKNKLLNWNGGISLSRIIASNALVYDGYNEAYYNNNHLLRKTQISLLAGINTQFELGATSVHLGPQFQYGATNLFNHNDYGSQHLFAWGLQANIFLKR